MRARAVGLGDQPAICTQWQADPNSPMYSSNPMTMANAQLYCLYGPGNYTPVRQPTVQAIPGSDYGPAIATAISANPILAAGSTSINTGGVYLPNADAPYQDSPYAAPQPISPGGSVPNPPIQQTPLQRLAGSVPQSVYGAANWLNGLDSNGNPSAAIPGWVWIAMAGAAGVALYLIVR